MSDRQKEFNFYSFPLRDNNEWKPVSAIGGISIKAGEAFSNEGYFYAYQIVGKYMDFMFDEELFKIWLLDIMTKNGHTDFKAENLTSAHISVKKWCENFL